MPHSRSSDVPSVALLGGRVRVRVPASGGLRPGLDAVVLAAACPALTGERVVDLGCGTGAAALCLAARVPAVQAFGVEADPALAALAAQGGLPAVCADVQRFFVTRPFDHVIANPPFYAAGAHTPPPEATRARALVGAGLEAWARCAARVLRPGGTLTLIHRPEALPEIVLVLRGRFGAARMAPLWPRAGAPASRLVVTAVKGTRGPMVLAPGLVLHEDDGSWTAPTRAVLEDAQALA